MLYSPFLFILFLFSSCALFKTQPSLENKTIDSMVKSIKVTGEGRGRLGIGQQSYLFSYEAGLKDQDWMLAVSVPLHGEEIMILHEIKQTTPPTSSRESFELRIDHEMRSRLSLGKITGRDVTQELRAIIRFVMSSDLGLEKECNLKDQKVYECKMDKDIFHVDRDHDSITIKKNIKDTHYFELIGENYTDSTFQRTNFYLRSQQEKAKSQALMSLELFWKH
jgi:hypothetical protein